MKLQEVKVHHLIVDDELVIPHLESVFIRSEHENKLCALAIATRARNFP